MRLICVILVRLQIATLLWQSLHYKPANMCCLAVSNEDAAAIVQATEDAWLHHGSVLNVNIGMRFSGVALEMRRLISSNSIGAITQINLRLLAT